MSSTRTCRRASGTSSTSGEWGKCNTSITSPATASIHSATVSPPMSALLPTDLARVRAVPDCWVHDGKCHGCHPELKKVCACTAKRWPVASWVCVVVCAQRRERRMQRLRLRGAHAGGLANLPHLMHTHTLMHTLTLMLTLGYIHHCLCQLLPDPPTSCCGNISSHSPAEKVRL